MKKFIHILFYQLVVVAFAAAVLEVDLCGYDHTFFDSCDYYTVNSGTRCSTYAVDANEPKADAALPQLEPFNSLPNTQAILSGQPHAFNRHTFLTDQSLFVKYHCLLI